jgi:hypothetical protein
MTVKLKTVMHESTENPYPSYYNDNYTGHEETTFPCTNDFEEKSEDLDQIPLDIEYPTKNNDIFAPPGHSTIFRYDRGLKKIRSPPN